ncbi:MAG: VWA domain-containing protein [Candidatus Latescibacteria bacterium]|nr:VWA domain-containing protein [Candidatus Latescibacterota bacterium]
MAAVRPYSEEISRTKPSCIAFLVDQSGSMAEGFEDVPAADAAKAQGAADALNRCLANIIMRCTKDEGIRDYFYVGIWGYGQSVSTALPGTDPEHPLVPVSELYTLSRIENRVRQIPDGKGGMREQTIKYPVWIDPQADGETPMCDAFDTVRASMNTWMEEHPDSYPPTIINITDGASTDGDPRYTAWKIMQTQNGNRSKALLFNIHITANSKLPPILYPSADNELQSYAKNLFEMSSELPDKLVIEAVMGGMDIQEGAHGFVFNGGLNDLIRFLDIGTRMTAMADMREG